MNQNYPPIHFKIEDMKKQGINVAEVEIGPEDAIYLLKKSKGNRPLRQNEIAKYIEMINAGNWVIGNDALMLDIYDVLQNFHHRLYAIISAGKRVKILLRINCKPEEVKFIDTGIKRNPMDVSHFDSSVDYLNPKNVVIARVCLSDGGSSYSDRDLSNNAICEWVNKYKEGINKVCLDFFANKEEKNVTQSVVYGAFTLALLNNRNEDALRYAGRYLIDPSSQERRHGTNTLQELRDALKEGKPTSAGGSARKDVFQMTCIFLNSFLNNYGDLNSKEMLKKPAWKIGKGYVAYNPKWFPCPDVKKIKKLEPVFMFHLNLAVEFLPSNLFSAAEIARKMIEAGYKVNSKSPEQLTAKKLLRMFKNTHFIKLSKGILCIEEHENKKVLRWDLAA